MLDYAETIKSMRICLNVDRDSNCLSECFGCNYISHDNHVMDMVRDAADAIEELLAAVPHWISVEERLPEQFICVFATDGEDVGIAAFQGFIDDYPVWSNAWNLEYIEDQYDEDFLQVTHWMPLPSTEGLNEA